MQGCARVGVVNLPAYTEVTIIKIDSLTAERYLYVNIFSSEAFFMHADWTQTLTLKVAQITWAGQFT